MLYIMLLAMLVFLSTATVDALFVIYTRSVINNSAFKAATVGSSIHLLNAFAVISYTQDWRFIFAVALGSWTGTYLCSRYLK